MHRGTIDTDAAKETCMGLNAFQPSIVNLSRVSRLGLGGCAAVESLPYSQGFRLHATAGTFLQPRILASFLAISYCSFGPWLFCRRVGDAGSGAFFHRVIRGCFVYSTEGGVVGLPSWIDCGCPPYALLAQGDFEMA
jgi:hypothetical protein